MLMHSWNEWAFWSIEIQGFDWLENGLLLECFIMGYLVVELTYEAIARTKQ